MHAGFREVRSMRGGIDAWQGKVAKGLPEEDVAFFTAAGSPQEQIILAWRLEEGTRRFYTEMAESVQDLESVSLFRELAYAEEHHKATLQALYEGISAAPAVNFQEWAVKPDELWMEGGMRLLDAVAWTRGRQINDILELGIALETTAYDRYLRLSRDLPDENSRRVFEVLADEERHHLEKLSRLLDHFI
jgi:rubrerythrin